MKTISKLILAVVVMLTSFTAQAKWEHVYTNSIGDKVYIDDGSMTENVDDASIIQAWTLTNSIKPVSAAGISYLSLAIRYEFDCNNMTSRFLQGVAYSKQNQAGRMVMEYTEEESVAKGVIPNTGRQKALQYACKE